MAIRLEPTQGVSGLKPRMRTCSYQLFLFRIADNNKNDLRFHWNMPAGLKRTSSDFFVSAEVVETAANTYTEAKITLPLNSLDREVFVITGILFDPATPSAIAATQCDSTIQLTRNTSANMVNLSEFNLISLSTETIVGGAGEFSFFSKTYGNQITDTGADYVDVVATPDMYVAVQGANNAGALTSSVRVFGYRATADVSVYSALVASELNS